MPIVSASNPRLFDPRISDATTSLDQYVGTETEIDPKQARAPMLFDRRIGSDRATATHYTGADTEIDPNPPGVRFRQNRDADSTAGADVKEAPRLFGQIRGADPITAAQYFGTDTEMDPKPSDRRLKQEICRIGVSPSGLPIYSFRYIWGGPIYVGVMAQDLLATRPDAVIQSEGGYLMVDYDKIDVRLRSFDTLDALPVAAEETAAFSVPALFTRRRAADESFAAQHVGAESVGDVKPPVTFAAARYVGTDTEIDVNSV